MGYPLRFHVLLLPNVAWPELRLRVVRLEELSIEVAALADHVVDWANPSIPWLETWTALPALAEATSTIRLATLVSQIPLRNPVMLARQALTLDQVSGGRMELGLGTGIAVDPSPQMVGERNWEAPERVARFREYVEVVGELLTGCTATASGRFYRAEAAVVTLPVQRPRPPITVAALGRSMLRVAAQHADIWNSLSFKPTVEEQLAETRERCRAIDAACLAIDRDPATLRRSYTLFDAAARGKGGAMAYYASDEALIDQVIRLVELGISDIGLYYPLDPGQVPAFERIATELLPVLRAQNPTVSPV